MSKDKILIIDDDIPLSEEVSEALTESGFRVKCARSQDQFSKKNEEFDFDIFIVDLLLPDGNGHDIIKKIRSTSDAGIIVLTGKLSEVDTVVSLELGADDYIVKPFSKLEFIARVRRLAARLEAKNDTPDARAAEANEITYGPLLTNMDARKLYAPSGVEIMLTKLEFDLWTAFIKNIDRVLTRDQLIFAIRGQDWAGYDRAIDGLVSRLRKKLSSHVEIDSQFETIRGVGYLLRACARTSLAN